MAVKTRPIFNNFSSGEISPKIDGRIDLTQYFNGVQELRNWLCVPQGGAKTRGGFHFVGEIATQGRLIPFQFSELQNYMLVFLDQKIWFFMNCGQIMVGDGSELMVNGTFPAGITDWSSISTGTGAVTWDTNHMEISGGATGIGWAEQERTVVDESIYLLKFDVTAFPLKLRVGTASGLQDIVAETTYAVGTDYQVLFVANGTSAFIQFKNANNNLAELDNVSCQLAIPYHIDSPYYADDDLWSIRFVQDDENLYLVHPLYPPQILTKGVGHTSFTINPITFIDGPYEDEINTPKINPSGSALGANIALDASGPLFDDPGHLGALWRIKHTTTWGYVLITAVPANNHAHATVMSALDGSGSDAVAHREGAWSELNGWPRTICFHEGKLLFASNYEHPQTIWGSKSGSGHYTDFTPGVLDNDAYSFTLADLNIIRWISPGRVLSIGALNAEATAVGPSDGPITAVDPPRIKSETTHGSSDLIAPVKVGKAILFLQRAARKIREFVYSYTEDSYGAPDITIASDHLFNLDILDLVYQQEPDSMLWGLRADGVLLPCTYDRMQDPTKGGIIGWAKAYTDGLFESIASIPYLDKDQLWAIVIRTIGTETKRYIEYYDPDICVDSGLTYSGIPITTISGLKHLFDKSVVIVGDGAPYPAQIVPASGELIIDPPASNIYVGLAYTPRIVTNRPEVQISGTSQGLMKAWNKIIVRVLNTTGITINGQVVPARTSTDLMGSAPAPFSGEVNVTNLGWDTEGRITIIQPLPLPAHIISITGDLIIGDS